jgi:hypothetical protein
LEERRVLCPLIFPSIEEGTSNTLQRAPTAFRTWFKKSLAYSRSTCSQPCALQLVRNLTGAGHAPSLPVLLCWLPGGAPCLFRVFPFIRTKVCDRLLGKESPDPHVYGVALLLMIVCGFLFGAVLVRRVLHTAAEDSRSDINLFLEEIKSLRRTTAVLNITTEVIESGREAEPAA